MRTFVMTTFVIGVLGNLCRIWMLLSPGDGMPRYSLQRFWVGMWTLYSVCWTSWAAWLLFHR
jgi:hypothetical protein